MFKWAPLFKNLKSSESLCTKMYCTGYVIIYHKNETFFFLFYVQIYSPAWSFRKVDSSSIKIVKNFVNIIQIKPKRIWIRYVKIVDRWSRRLKSQSNNDNGGVHWWLMAAKESRIKNWIPLNRKPGYTIQTNNINFIYLFIHSLLNTNRLNFSNIWLKVRNQ